MSMQAVSDLQPQPQPYETQPSVNFEPTPALGSIAAAECLDELGGATGLSRETEVKDPRIEDRNQQVLNNMGIALRLARHFYGRGEEADDLRQVALTEMVAATDRFEPDRGVNYSTFITASVLGALKRHFRDRAWAVRPPRDLHDRFLKVAQAIELLSAELGREPTQAEVAKRTRLSEEAVAETAEVANARNSTSLDATSPNSDSSLGEKTADETAHMFAEETINRLGTHAVLSRLPERERTIIELLYFEGLNQAEVAERMGISQMHVSRLNTRALSLMQSYLSV